MLGVPSVHEVPRVEMCMPGSVPPGGLLPHVVPTIAQTGFPGGTVVMNLPAMQGMWV